jgi:nascent polypeptide-associated complex subunit beta
MPVYNLGSIFISVFASHPHSFDSSLRMPPKITKEMLEKRANEVRTGGKGSVRRTVKAVHRGSGEDKKVTTTLKRLGVTPVSDVAEATMMRTDGSAFVFKNPKVQASMQSQCFVVSGNYDTKSLQEVFPGLAAAAAAAAPAATAESA